MVCQDGPGVERLLPSERQQPLNQGGGAIRRCACCIDIAIKVVHASLAQAKLQQLQTSLDSGQDIVEIMGGALP